MKPATQANENSFELRDIAIKPQPAITLPDRTKLRSIFSNNDISNEFMDKFSCAIGIIEPGVSSHIHIHPIVTQVTCVYSGTLTAIMKATADKAPYAVVLNAWESLVTHPYTFLQLMNKGNSNCIVTYTANPAFLYECHAISGEVIYNDAVVLNESWQTLAAANWIVPALQKSPQEFAALRNASKCRFAIEK